MRDDQIYRMHESEARRVALLYTQFEFLMTRQNAMEVVFYSAGFWKRLDYFFRPLKLKADVDALHAKMIVDSRNKLEQARAKMAEEQKRPKVILPTTMNGGLHA